MGIRDYLKGTGRAREINRAIRSAFDRRRGNGTRGARILVLDHDPLTRETMVRTLLRAGYDALGAADREQALAGPVEQWLDLVVVDASLPERDGLGTVAELRRRYPDLAIVAVNAPAQPADQRFGASGLGATRTLTKPFDSQRLLGLIAELLGR